MPIHESPEEGQPFPSARKPKQRRQRESVDVVGDVVSGAIGSTHKHPILEGFEQLEPAQRMEVLLRALLAERMMQSPEKLNDLRLKAHFVHSMQRALIQFVETIQGQKRDLEKTQRGVTELFDPKMRKKREQAMTSTNRDADLIDHITRELEQETIKLAAIVPVSSEYLTEAKPEDERVVDERMLVTDSRVNETAARVEGYLSLVDHMRKRADAFPNLCRGIVRAVEEYKKFLISRYGPGQDEEKEEGRMPSLFMMMGYQAPEREDVPIYKNNLHLTAFLHTIYRKIPSVRDEKKKPKKGDSGKKYDAAEANAFAEYLRSLSDRKLLGYIKTGEFFPAVAHALAELHGHYRILKQGVKDAEIEDVRGKNPDHMRLRYRNRMVQVVKEMKGQGEDKLETFDVKETVAMLSKTNLTSLPLPQVAGDGKVGTDKERKMLRIFEKIDDNLEKIAKGCPDPEMDWDVEAWVEELIEMKYEVSDQQKKKRRRSRMRIDRSRDNYRYEVLTGGISDLRLEQIPSDETTFDDVFGKSWKEVRARFDAVLKFAELEFVHTRMGPRRRMSAHTLVLGPFGSGKNHFSRALTSDPRVVGVEVSIGRLLTAWAGEAEANIGRLFRETHKKREKHEKPAIIVADEFDAFFGKKGENTVDRMLLRMQKELQTMLDGNVDYDGVFMFGLSNEPHNIPPEIYRRMGQQRVFVIRALTGAERVSLVQHLLSGIPLSPDFKDKVNMKEFAERTEHASGETVGKIAEYTYEAFRTIFDQKHHRRLFNIEEEARDMYGQGEKITPAHKVRIFQKGVGEDVRITPEIFNFAVDQVIESPQVQAEMISQKRFYEDVDDMLSAAFEGRQWPDPGFDPPSHGIRDRE